jgi:hypothetical protein
MKIRYFVALLSIGLFCVTLPAAENIDEHLKVLTTRLKLSSDQQAKVKVILQEEADQIDSISKDQTLPATDKSSRDRVLRATAATRIRVLLNDDQRKIFDDIEREHTGHGEGQSSSTSSTATFRGAGDGFGLGIGQGCEMPSFNDHVQFLAEQLSLTNSQRSLMGAVIGSQLAKLGSIRSDPLMSKAERTTRVNAFREQSATRIREMLNDEQKKKFDDLRENTPRRSCAMIWSVSEE